MSAGRRSFSANFAARMFLNIFSCFSRAREAARKPSVGAASGQFMPLTKVSKFPVRGE
jgi:hypothetical protein